LCLGSVVSDALSRLLESAALSIQQQLSAARCTEIFESGSGMPNEPLVHTANIGDSRRLYTSLCRGELSKELGYEAAIPTRR
jgi:hypothetical protein